MQGQKVVRYQDRERVVHEVGSGNMGRTTLLTGKDLVDEVGIYLPKKDNSGDVRLVSIDSRWVTKLNLVYAINRQEGANAPGPLQSVRLHLAVAPPRVSFPITGGSESWRFELSWDSGGKAWRITGFSIPWLKNHLDIQIKSTPVGMWMVKPGSKGKVFELDGSFPYQSLGWIQPEESECKKCQIGLFDTYRSDSEVGSLSVVCTALESGESINDDQEKRRFSSCPSTFRISRFL
jgi:hypothetical protein